MALLGLHVTVLVQELQDELRWLPADVKAALLAVARCGCAALCVGCWLAPMMQQQSPVTI
jgi:hypothetical protein